MIELIAKEHDDFSVEFKFAFEDDGHEGKDEFAVNAWMFLPASLGLDPDNYGKSLFYRDIRSNVRLITPDFSLEEIDSEDSPLFSQLRRAVDALRRKEPGAEEKYEYHIKMFAAIFKSAVRDCIPAASSAVHIRSILGRYRHITGDEPRAALADEFMSYVLDLYLLRSSASSGEVLSLLSEEKRYREVHGYGVFTGEMFHDRELGYHHGLLKKYVESELYIDLDKKRDGIATEQLLYSIAAGIAMVFATAVSWLSNARLGSFTFPLFIVLVISYMMKDRIKDLMRYYFVHKLSNKYYDHKAEISIGSTKVGVLKEGVDFISLSRTPSDVLGIRGRGESIANVSGILEEHVLLYRKHLTMDVSALSANDEYPTNGINDIIRLNLARFAQKMDDPENDVEALGSGASQEITTYKVQKIYYIHIVFQLRYSGQLEYRHYRIGLTRSGILSFDQV